MSAPGVVSTQVRAERLMAIGRRICTFRQPRGLHDQDLPGLPSQRGVAGFIAGHWSDYALLPEAQDRTVHDRR